MWWVSFLLLQIITTFILGYIVGLAAAHAKNVTGPENDQTHIYSSALSTAIVVTGIPLIIQLLLYLGLKTPKLIGPRVKLFRQE